MTTNPIIARIHRILVDEFELDESAMIADADLYQDLGLDSLDSVDLVVALEKEFRFRFNRIVDEAKVREARTLRQMYAFVQEKTATVGDSA